MYGDLTADDGIRAVHAAIDQGINFFDTSPYYGLTVSEERLGNALRGRRDKVLIATKCGRYGEFSFDFSASRLRASVDESLSRLRTDYIDLFQAHDVEFYDSRTIVEEAVPALRELQREGKVRYIGLTGLQLRNMREIAALTPVDTILSYCRYNLMIHDMDTILTPFMREKGMGLINASPYHMGVLTEAGPRAWHLGSAAMKQAGEVVVRLCRSRGVDLPSLALRYCLNHPYVSTTVAGMASAAEVENNVRALSFVIDPALLKEIQAIIAPVADLSWDSGLPENQDPRRS